MEIKGIKDYYDDTTNIWADDWYEHLTMLPFLKKLEIFCCLVLAF